MTTFRAEAPLDLAALRNEYARETLDETAVDRDPMKQFAAWMAEAIGAQVPEPTAMTVSTVGANGRPSARICLLKGADARGFVFFTNYDSRKGRELAKNPVAALTFMWKESSAYYLTRPLGSRIGAWASPQSEAIENRGWLERRWAELSAQYGESPTCPPHWGGYRVIPDYLEFWQGRASRLHDRIAYTRAADAWTIARLAP